MLRLVVMGVAGCGKSAVGRRLTQAMGGTLIEGDDYHLPASVDKMRRGIALDDADRWPWLARLAEVLAASPGDAVLSCSALKRRYRELLRTSVPGLRFVYLEIDLHTAAQRAQSRPDHFFPMTLVRSQFTSLESPIGEPGVLTVSALLDPEAQCRAITQWLVNDLPLPLPTESHRTSA